MCCCSDKPGDLSCCDCLNSSYSIACSISWTSATTDGSGFGDVDASLSYSGFVVTEQACTTAFNGNSNVLFRATNPTGAITGADVSLDFTNTSVPPEPSLTCTDVSVSGATLDAVPPYFGSCRSSNPSPERVGPLVCWHYYKADGTSAYRWYHQSCFSTQALCADPFRGPKLWGLVNAFSPEQSSCHAPPSSGWTVQTGSITSYCQTQNFCRPQNFTASNATNKSFSLTIT